MYAFHTQYVCRPLFFFLHSVLDDYDLFERQKYFKASDFSEIAVFLNNLMFTYLWEERDLSVSTHYLSLLSMLYNRDCKQHFCTEENWLIRLFVS